MGCLCRDFGLGTIRGFYNPSATSFKPFLIPREFYANGATWTTIGWQSGGIIGPMLGGFMLAFLGRETSFISATWSVLFTRQSFKYSPHAKKPIQYRYELSNTF